MGRFCKNQFQIGVEKSSGVEIFQIKLSNSNVYFIRSKKKILVDAGAPGDLNALMKAFNSIGESIDKLDLVALTHGHGDHAGLARQLQKHGAKIALGRGDLFLARQGHNDDLKSTNITARILKPMVDFHFETYIPDYLVEDEMSPEEFGIQGKLKTFPGHTPGALVLLFDDHRAIVGDMLLGGFMGGAIFPSRAGEHYYQADINKNHENIRILLKLGIETFHVGHGGPVNRKSVQSVKVFFED